MNNLISTALVMAGIFIVCYPVVILLFNRIMTKIEHDNNEAKTIS